MMLLRGWRCRGMLPFGSALSVVGCLNGAGARAMDELKDAYERLLAVKSSQEKTRHLQDILNVLERDGIDRTQASECAVEIHVLTKLMEIISGGAGESELCLEKAMQLVAELSKTESARSPCVSEGLVAPLVQLLGNENPAICVQACRALGNICFDNDDGRDEVFSNSGAQRLVHLMGTAVGRSDEPFPRLRLVACGCLLNLANTHGVKLSGCNVQRQCNVYKMQQAASPLGPPDNMRMISLGLDLDMTPAQESVQEQALLAGALEIIKDFILKHRSDDRLLQMALMCVDALADSDRGREAISECSLASSIADLLRTPEGRELRDAILELLTSLAENDAIKLQLAKSSLVNALLEIFAECKSCEEFSSTEKLSADLIVLILTGDGSVEEFYNEGQGIVYRETVGWLSSQRPHLQAAGALAMGNFARSDIHCIQLVHEGVAEKLLQLLERTKDDAEDEGVPEGFGRAPTLQHAVLSALRNLAIPAANKPVLAQTQLVERVLPCIKTDVSPVQFKLLATFRMLVDGQERVIESISSNEEFLQRLSVSCTAEDHAGVKGEACRLVAWMVKHSCSSQVMQQLVNAGLCPHLVQMVSSEHAVMQNEALLALSLITTSCKGAIATDDVRDSLLPSLKKLLEDADAQAEIHHNILTLCKVMADNRDYKAILIEANLDASVQKLVSSEEKNLSAAAKTLADALKTT